MRGEKEIKLEQRMMEVLVELAENGKKPVSTDALLKEFWSDENGNELYDENPVTKSISALRKKIGDHARNPRYIRTVSKQGYCIIPKVQFAEGYRHVHRESGTWTRGNPYVGLKSFDQGHADVFQGRSATVADLMQAMREQIDNERRFVLIVGPSGCGKTSLVHASMIPTVAKKLGFDGLHALSVAICDLGTASDGDLITILAASLAAWKLGDHEFFSLHPHEHLRKMLIEAPEKVSAVIEEGFRRHPVRDIEKQPHAHLLLTIDHAESIVAARNVSMEQRSCFARAIRALCNTPRVLTTMIARLDFYPALTDALPELADYRSGHGHFEVSTPSEGELAKIIRKPAALAGVDFEEHPKNQVFLDDLLCKKAIAQPDALPLLQHTLHALFERCGETGLLTYAVYDEIGGLEGAIARRAEEVFGGLPMTVQDDKDRILGRIFARLVVIQPDSGAVSASSIVRNRLDYEANQMVQEFINAHLFVSDLDAGQPIVKVTHEALLRQWPRAADWIKENLRLLQAKTRLQHAAQRWKDEGRRDDHLLNPGRPLSEAQEVLAKIPDDLKPEVHALIAASGRSDRRRRRLRKLAIAALAAFGVSSLTFAVMTYQARNEAEVRRIEAEERRIEAEQNNTFMLKKIARDLGDLGDLRLLESISERAISTYEKKPLETLSLEDLLNFSRALRILGKVRMGQGKWQLSQQYFLRAEEIARRASNENPESADAQYEFAQTSFWRGHHQILQKRFGPAKHHFDDYLTRAKSLRSFDVENPEWIMEESFAQNNLGTLFWTLGDSAAALTHLQHSLALKQKAVGPASRDEWKKELADTLSWVGMALDSLGRLDDAAIHFKNAIKELTPVVARNRGNKEWAVQLANFRQLEALSNLSRGLSEEARISIDLALETMEPLANEPSADHMWIYRLASAHQIAGDCDRVLGHPEDSEAHYTRSLGILEKIKGDGTDARQRRLKAVVELGLTRLRGVETESSELESIVKQIDLLRVNTPSDAPATISLADALLLLAEHRRFQGNVADARKAWRRALKISDATQTNKLPPQLMATRAVARLHLDGSAAAAQDIDRLARINYRHPDYLSMLQSTH
jgi:tetratricopeptide (TPR) repeat protein/DNA-binding winged helix-turn-helix (wHTH) protein